MEICKTLEEWQQFREKQSTDIGLIPTMGALHAGHMKLIEEARKTNLCVVVSIFVNPSQFENNEDLEKYPRPLTEDLEKLAKVADAVFCPTTQQMYPEQSTTIVEVQGVSNRLIGETRNGHFRGVTTIVMKLLNIIQPSHAYFGEKDYQQLHIIRRMAKDLFIPCTIIGVPSVRDHDGVALSSRNQRLSPKERKAASIIPQAIQQAKTLMAQKPCPQKILNSVRQHLQQEPLAEIVSIDLCASETLLPWQGRQQNKTTPVLLLAVRFGKVLLIDQAELEE